MEFYRAEPTAVTSWRMAVLMGANSRTYKFALGNALLQAVRSGRDSVPLRELAGIYALQLAHRARRFPQGPITTVKGAQDFLTIVREESEQTLQLGGATERLTDAAVASMPQMVMQKFHNLRGVGAVEHTFYELRGGGGARRDVVLTSELRAVARHDDLLRAELDARWSIVEACFDAELGQALVDSGVILSRDGKQLLTPVRRVSLTGAREGLMGFQRGRCFYCSEPLDLSAGAVHVDHVYPYSLMRSGSWAGPDLNGLWNLVVACAPCNLTKSSRLPASSEVANLLARNEAVAGSPHPLRRALELSMRSPSSPAGTTPALRRSFVGSVDNMAIHGGLG